MKNSKRTADSFVDGAKTLPREYFVNEQIFEQEKEKIFYRTWMCVGHVSALNGVGGYFVQEILGESLIILLDKSKQVRAFYNVCRHMGTRICMESQGNFTGSILCNYHKWTYKFTGELQNAQYMEDVVGFDPKQNGLHSVPVHVWEGFIFVWMGDSAPVPFEKIYESMLGKLADWNVANLVEVHRDPVLVNANHKTIAGNFSECLHCDTIHPTLNKHLSYLEAENDLDEGTCLGGPMQIVGGESMTMNGELCALPLGELNERTRRKGWYYCIFPTLLINAHPEYLMFHMLFPVSAGQTLIVTVWLFNPASLGRDDFHPEQAIEIWNQTNHEDWKVCERNHLGITSRKYEPGSFSTQQSMWAAFDREYLKWMG